MQLTFCEFDTSDLNVISDLFNDVKINKISISIYRAEDLKKIILSFFISRRKANINY